jgi:uncharacterized membrane protein YphA (DoxX/SURF4 family)
MIALTYVAEPVVPACLAIGVLARIIAAVIGIEMLILIGSSAIFRTNRGAEFARRRRCSTSPSYSRAAAL